MTILNNILVVSYNSFVMICFPLFHFIGTQRWHLCTWDYFITICMLPNVVHDAPGGSSGYESSLRCRSYIRLLDTLPPQAQWVLTNNAGFVCRWEFDEM